MHCNICENRRIELNIFKINICKVCLRNITSLSVLDKDYEKYKNLIRIVLSYYINPKRNIDNLVF